MIRGAAAGNGEEREAFAQLYAPLIRAYLAARWQVSATDEKVEEGVQEVFVECFKSGGFIGHVNSDPPIESFRAFLYGAVRNVARRIERSWATCRERTAPSSMELGNVEKSEATLSRVFDRAWAESIVCEAAAVQASEAKEKGQNALRRVELMRLRFTEGKPIRDIARLWHVDPNKLHRQYELARKEYREALWKVVRFHHPDSPENVRRAFSEVLTTLGASVEKEFASLRREGREQKSHDLGGKSAHRTTLVQ